MDKLIILIIGFLLLVIFGLILFICYLRGGIMYVSASNSAIEYQERKINENNQILEETENSITEKRKELKDVFDSIEELEKEKCNIEDERDKLNYEVESLRASLAAGAFARIREQEIQEKQKFYSLTVTDDDLNDFKSLAQIRTILHRPEIINKLIWSTYFQKQTNDLCNRVFGTETVTGIYKITNINTEQCYIGQSTNIQNRIKTHIKCGLGIDSSASNKLYNAMQKVGVWNFTFELLEACPQNDLNAKERMWIEMYESDKFGYNSTLGVKS